MSAMEPTANTVFDDVTRVSYNIRYIEGISDILRYPQPITSTSTEINKKLADIKRQIESTQNFTQLYDLYYILNESICGDESLTSHEKRHILTIMMEYSNQQCKEIDEPDQLNRLYQLYFASVMKFYETIESYGDKLYILSVVGGFMAVAPFLSIGLLSTLKNSIGDNSIIGITIQFIIDNQENLQNLSQTTVSFGILAGLMGVDNFINVMNITFASNYRGTINLLNICMSSVDKIATLLQNLAPVIFNEKNKDSLLSLLSYIKNYFDDGGRFVLGISDDLLSKSEENSIVTNLTYKTANSFIESASCYGTPRSNPSSVTVTPMGSPREAEQQSALTLSRHHTFPPETQQGVMSRDIFRSNTFPGTHKPISGLLRTSTYIPKENEIDFSFRGRPLLREESSRNGRSRSRSRDQERDQELKEARIGGKRRKTKRKSKRTKRNSRRLKRRSNRKRVRFSRK